jgi:predicted nucleotidyltransferase
LSSLLKARLELRKLARNWRFWCERIAGAAKEVLGSCEVYVFGSVVKGRVTGASDVDVLIVGDQLPGDCRSLGNLKARIEEAAGLPLYHPFEIHMATKKEAEENPIYRTAVYEGMALEGKRRRA